MAYKTYYDPSSNDYLTVDYDEPTQAAWGKGRGLIDAMQPLDWTQQVPGWQPGYTLNPMGTSSPKWIQNTNYQPQAANWNTNNTGGTNMADGLPGSGGVTGTGRNLGFEEKSPFAAYLRQRGLPGYGYTPAQAWQEEQFDPMYAAWKAQKVLAGRAGENMDWGTYMGGTDPMAARGQALEALTTASGRNTGEQQTFMSDLGDDFKVLIFGALQKVYGNDIASRMMGRFGGVQEQYKAETEGAGGNFLTYLRQKYNLV